MVIDSLSGFKVAVAQTFRQDFQESLYRLVGALTAAGAVMNESLQDYHGTITGVPSFDRRVRHLNYPGLTEPDAADIDTLIRLRAAPVELLAMHTPVALDEMERRTSRRLRSLADTVTTVRTDVAQNVHIV